MKQKKKYLDRFKMEVFRGFQLSRWDLKTRVKSHYVEDTSEKWMSVFIDSAVDREQNYSIEQMKIEGKNENASVCVPHGYGMVKRFIRSANVSGKRTAVRAILGVHEVLDC